MTPQAKAVGLILITLAVLIGLSFTTAVLTLAANNWLNEGIGLHPALCVAAITLQICCTTVFILKTNYFYYTYLLNNLKPQAH